MRNLSITSVVQSKRLADAGLGLSTADYHTLVKMDKQNGIINIEETPFLIDKQTDWDTVLTNPNFTVAWSLGKLIEMMPSELISQWDENGNDVGADINTEFHLIILKNEIIYSNDVGMEHLTSKGACLLDAAVDMMEKLLKEDRIDTTEVSKE